MRRTLTIIIALLVIPGVLYAHVRMMDFFPLQDSVLSEAPTKVAVTFMGSVEPAFSKIEVFGPDGKKVSQKTTYLEYDTIMEAQLDEGLSPGEYTVKWNCMSLDGHMMTGEYRFTIQ